MKVNLTEKAIEKGLEVIKNSLTPNGWLRLGVKGGSCAGFQYVIETTDKRTNRDEEFIFNELKVVIDKKSLKLLDNLILDYETNLMYYGFKFINPNAKNECSCGKSFST